MRRKQQWECLEYCRRRRIWLDIATQRAAIWLERHGYRFLVHFGHDNARQRVREAKAGWLR